MLIIKADGSPLAALVQRCARTLASLSSEKVSTMMPKTMLRPMVVTMMKKEMSYINLHPSSRNTPDTSGTAYMKQLQLIIGIVIVCINCR